MKMLRNHFSRIFVSKSGMSLVEVLVAVGLISVIALGVASALNVGLKGQKGVDNLNQASDFANEVEQYLNQQSVCTLNMQSHFAGPVTEGFNFTFDVIRPVVTGGGGVMTLDTTSNPLVQIPHPTFGVRLGIQADAMEFHVDRQISNRFFIGKVRMRLRAIQQGAGSEVMIREFPIGIGVVGGNFASCGGLKGDDSRTINTKICEISTGGDSFYDGTQCQSKFEYQNFGGTIDSVTCPAGWTVATSPNDFCQIMSTIGPANPPVVSRKGVPLAQPFASSAVIIPATNSCECDVAAVVTGGVCTLRCKRQIHFP